MSVQLKRNNRDWMMCLSAVQKFRKMDLYLKNERVLLYCSVIFAFFAQKKYSCLSSNYLHR